MIFKILDNNSELWMTKYIIGEIFSSCGATLYKNPSDQTLQYNLKKYFLIKLSKKQLRENFFPLTINHTFILLEYAVNF